MPAKKINIGEGYEVRFDQRAKGQETPYYDGTIFKDGEEVSRFHNGGTGGPTIIYDSDTKEAFQKMVDDHCEALGITDYFQLEREAAIIEAAEALGYDRVGKQFADRPAELIRELIRQCHEQMQQFR